MDWERFELFFGGIRVGLVYLAEGDAPFASGHFILDPDVSDPKTAETIRLARFIALARECARLSDLMDEHGFTPEHQSAEAELAEVGAAFCASENWCLVNVLKHRIPIACPEFSGDDRLAWLWETGAE